MELSIVTTLYNSAPHLREFHTRISAAAQQLTSDYEIVMVDDGSPDDSLAVALELVNADSRVRVVELSRNFGHHRAIMTGLEHSRGELVFLIDCDLEEDPELLIGFHARLVASGADVVFGQQESRKGGWAEHVGGALFYRAFNELSDTPIPPNVLTVRLMQRSYVEALTSHREREVFLGGLMTSTGFRQVPQPVEKAHKGRSSYDLRRKTDLALRAITSFTDRPLELLAGLGFGLFAISGLVMLTMLVCKLAFAIDVPGYASLMVSVWFLGGITLFGVGLIGVYVARVFSEVKQRPYTIVRALHENHASTRTVETSRSPLATLSRGIDP